MSEPKLLTEGDLAVALRDVGFQEGTTPWKRAKSDILSHIEAQRQEIERWRLLFKDRALTARAGSHDPADVAALEQSTRARLGMDTEPTITVEDAGRWLVQMEADLAHANAQWRDAEMDARLAKQDRDELRKRVGMAEAALARLAEIAPCPHSGEPECHFSEPCETCALLGRKGTP